MSVEEFTVPKVRSDRANQGGSVEQKIEGQYEEVDILEEEREIIDYISQDYYYEIVPDE